MKIEVGDIISCPNCQASQMEATAEVEPGQQLKDALWQSLGFDMSSQKMQCYKCKTDWHRFHPARGWPQIYLEDKEWFSSSRVKPEEKTNDKLRVEKPKIITSI